jgi:Entner-Doudoroff aldolase
MNDRPPLSLNANIRRFDAALAAMPVVAILRGLVPEDALEVVQALHDEGVRVAEVPLNSPRPFETIRLLVERFGERMCIGAGTVTTVEAVRALAATGASLCVCPNTDVAVIRAAVAAGLVVVPGYQTPSEAFTALAAGARHLKLFPAAGRESEIASLRAVLPPRVRILAVGGARPQDLPAILRAGADGVGVGWDLYRPGDDAVQVRLRAQAWRHGWARAQRAPTVEVCWNPEALVGEGPVWCAADASLRWVDPVRRRLLSYRAAAGTGGEQALDKAVCSLVVGPSGELIGALEDGAALIDANGGCRRRGSVALPGIGCRFNDMTADSRGNLWAGSMHRGLLAGRGALFRAAGVEGAWRQVAEGLGVPNGLAFDAEERTLYVVDTLARHLLAFPADVRGGSLGPPTIVTDFLDVPGKPDGLAIGPDGAPWVAMWGGGRVVRVGPGGAIEQQVALPAVQASSLCFDPDGDLWVTTSRMRLSEAQLASSPAAGALLRIRLHGRERARAGRVGG